MGFPLRSPYAASKWAVIGVTKTLAMELGKFKIRVNAICPGTIKGSRMVRVIRDKAKFLKVSKKLVEKEFVSMASMNCWIYEEDIGKMCSFLISSDGERISGQAIPVDGNATRIDLKIRLVPILVDTSLCPDGHQVSNLFLSCRNYGPDPYHNYEI